MILMSAKTEIKIAAKICPASFFKGVDNKDIIFNTHKEDYD